MKKTIKPRRIGIIKIFLLCAVFFLPLLGNYVVLFFNGFGLSLNNLLLYMNDEVYWHAQTAGAVKYGIPAGYFGYNGSSARLGTFNTWGPFPFAPYVILGKIFGMGIYSRHIFNIFFIGTALVVFFIMIKADVRNILTISLIFFLMPLNTAYLLTSMSEPERFALSVILAGIFIRLLCFDNGKVFRYAVAPTIILVSSFIYYLFLILIPAYLFIILKKKRIFHRIIISVVATLSISFIVINLTGILSAPYNIRSGLSDTTNRIKEYIFSGKGIAYAFLGIIKVFLGNLAHFGPRNLINISYFEKGFCSVFIAAYELSLAVLIFGYLLKFVKMKKNPSSGMLLVIYTMTGFLLAFALLYAEEPLTVLRGLNCGWIFGILVFFGTDLSKKNFRISCFFQTLLLSFVFISGVSFINETCILEYMASQKTERISTEKNRINSLMIIDPKGDRWDNTIAYYGDLSTEYLEIPEGFGLNYMTEGGVDDRMRWAVIHKEAETNKLLEKLEERYNQIYENDDFYIMVRIENENEE